MGRPLAGVPKCAIGRHMLCLGSGVRQSGLSRGSVLKVRWKVEQHEDKGKNMGKGGV